jgi:soluble lytic murein transglycosylase-like protein
MIAAWIIELVMLIAPQYDVPPMLVVSIIIKESQGNVSAININENGTVDRGLMQLNSSWFNDSNWQDAETNIRAGIIFLIYLYEQTKRVSPNWYAAIVSYNCGLNWFYVNESPPDCSIDYAISVMQIWANIDSVRARQMGIR